MTRRVARLPQLCPFLLLVWRQNLVDLRERRASDGRKLAHFAAFGARQLLDFRRVIGLDRSLQRLPRLLQLLPDRLPGLPRVLEIDFA
jgi:hypothetical protein